MEVVERNPHSISCVIRNLKVCSIKKHKNIVNVISKIFGNYIKNFSFLILIK